MKRRPASVLAASMVAMLGLVGCTAADQQPSTSASPSASAVSIPDSPLGEATSWALAAMQGETEVTESVVEERFAPATIEQIGTPADLVASFESLRTLGPYAVVSYEETGGVAGTRIEANGEGEGAQGTPYLLSVSLDDDGLLTTLAVQAAPEIPATASSWDELAERTDEIGVPVALTVFDVSDGDVAAPTFAAGALDGAQPSGSMIKLFVLLAVVDAVERGALAWDDVLTLSDSTRSLPSGELQDQPDGTEVTVEEAALGMMSISDNTATDLLIEAVGRETVEARIVEHAVDGADASVPLLSTRAFFQVGWGDERLRSQWAAADDAEREALLAQVAAAPLTTTAVDVAVPVWQDGVDWFLSAADLARASVALQEASATAAGEPLDAILTANPGLDDSGDWESAAFKGGSSVGVMGGTWLLEGDDATYVVVLQSATEVPEEYLVQRSAMYLGTNAAELLAEG